MTYARVVPRDLFNEGDLLNCLGRLWIKLDERRDHLAVLDEGDGQAFEIAQNPADGSISCPQLGLRVGDVPVPLFRPLNARGKWPLWSIWPDGEERRVFDLQGDLSPEFWVEISQEMATIRQEQRA